MTSRRNYYAARKFELGRMRLDELVTETCMVLDLEGNTWLTRFRFNSEGLRSYCIEAILNLEFPEFIDRIWERRRLGAHKYAEPTPDQ